MKPADALHRIDELADCNVFISVDRDASGEGDVVAVKDCLDVAGLPTTAGSVILDRTPCAADAPVVAAVRAAGCAIIGKANMHEFAFGVTNVNPHYGSIPNPFDPARIVGGSSGGSAAAVAYGMCDWAIGTDSGGSIRIPAALCGVVAIKPTAGSFDTSRGMIPLSASLDSVGPIARDVATAARALAIMRGEQVRSIATANRSDFRVAIPKDWAVGLDYSVRDTWDRVRDDYPEIEFPSRTAAARICNTILYAEASAYHRRWFTERPADYGPDVLNSIKMGREVRALDYLAALEERRSLSAEIESALSGWDAVLTPATACVAPALGPSDDNYEPLFRFTQPFNVSGHPVVTIPAPVEKGSLPVGVQVVGHLGREADVIAVAAALESSWVEDSGISIGMRDLPGGGDFGGGGVPAVRKP